MRFKRLMLKKVVEEVIIGIIGMLIGYIPKPHEVLGLAKK